MGFNKAFSFGKLSGGCCAGDIPIIVASIVLILAIIVFVAAIIYMLNPKARGFMKEILNMNNYKLSGCGKEGFLRSKLAPAYRNCEGVFDYDPRKAASADYTLSKEIGDMSKRYYQNNYTPCNIDVPNFTSGGCGGNKENYSLSSQRAYPMSDRIAYKGTEDGTTEDLKRKWTKRALRDTKACRSVNDPEIMKLVMEKNDSYPAVPGPGNVANQRVNSLMMQPLNKAEIKTTQSLRSMGNGVIVDDKYSGQQEAFLPITDSPALKTNSRVAGSSMSLNALGGTFFKKYDATDGFFLDNNGNPPELNITKGKPIKMNYKPHPDM